nr:MAG TPA: hypothetical protein [Caudoviricetes sp.]
MKRVLRILALVLIFSSFLAYAEKADYDEMSIDQLLEIRDQVDRAICKQKETDGIVITSGDYFSEVDIPTGKIMVTYLSSEKKYASLYIWKVATNGKDRVIVGDVAVSEEYPRGIIELEKDQMIRIENASVILTYLDN